MSVRIVEPAPTMKADGPRRRDVLIQVGEDAYLMEIEWQQNRYEFTVSHLDGDKGWAKVKKDLTPVNTWPDVVERVAYWIADTARDLL